MNNAAEMGDYLYEQLTEIKKLFSDDIKEIRGKGFMLGVEMCYRGQEIVRKMRERKVLTNCTNNTVLRLLPPLITEKKDIDYFLYNFHEVLKTNNAY
jgi:acetylornithine/N-succinyldiaminopimelate aminotransferase